MSRGNFRSVDGIGSRKERMVRVVREWRKTWRRRWSGSGIVERWLSSKWIALREYYYYFHHSHSIPTEYSLVHSRTPVAEQAYRASAPIPIS